MNLYIIKNEKKMILPEQIRDEIKYERMTKEIKSRKKKLLIIEGGLHKVHDVYYRLLEKDFDIEVITSDERDVGENIITWHPRRYKIISDSFTSYNRLYDYFKNYDIIAVRTWYRLYSLQALLHCFWHKKKFVVLEEQRNDPHKLFERIVFKIWKAFIKPLINLKGDPIICTTFSCFDYMNDSGFKNIEYVPVPYEPKVKKPNIKS